MKIKPVNKPAESYSIKWVNTWMQSFDFLSCSKNGRCSDFEIKKKYWRLQKLIFILITTVLILTDFNIKATCPSG